MSTPDAPIAAQIPSVWLRRTLVCAFGLVLAADTLFAQDEHTSFDIPSQPLAAALEAFSTASGYQILMADGGAIRSNAVKGIFAPRRALAHMISGTGLEARFTAPRAAVLVRDVQSQSASGSAPRKDRGRYDAALQNDVIWALCRDAATRPGQYRTALDLWVTSSGRVDRVELLSSTGNPDRDRRIAAALQAMNTAAPPPGLSQPTTLLLLPATSDSARICNVTLPHRRAAAR